MSSFAWLDSSEQERTQMLNVISLFREKETRDELGIGLVRDAFADLFFPGTSTIQTRARYFLFIPWLYLDLERLRVKSAEVERRSRNEEVRLINTLYDNGAVDGLIGIQARRSLKRLPSTIYWQGLGAWGIRHYDGSQTSYHRSLDSFYAVQAEAKQMRRDNRAGEEAAEIHLRPLANWDPGVMELRPADFPGWATFVLSQNEATYLKERLIMAQPDSLLAFLVAETAPLPQTSFAWEQPAQRDLPDRLQEQLHHARLFSLLIHGAALLYNLMLAELAAAGGRADAPDLVEDYQSKLNQWTQEVAAETAVLRRWDWQNRFWEIVQTGNPHLNPRTKQFVNDWLRLVVPDQAAAIADSPAARQLIRQREFRLKGKLARLSNPRALEMWGGAAGADRLDYRWQTAQTILDDIHRGIHDA
jgi:hypothetical protein